MNVDWVISLWINSYHTLTIIQRNVRVQKGVVSALMEQSVFFPMALYLTPSIAATFNDVGAPGPR